MPKYILVKPFTQRKVIYPHAQESLVLALDPLKGNLSLRLAKIAIAQAETSIKIGRTAFWPELGLTTTYTTKWGETRISSSSGQDAFIGVGFRMNLWDNGANRAKLKINKLQLENAKLDLEKVTNTLEEDIFKAHRAIATSVEELASLLVSYKKTKESMIRYLNTDNKATVRQKLNFVDRHFEAARSLALEQHVYLLKTLDLLSLRNELDHYMLARLEDVFFTECTKYDDFLKLSEVIFH